MSGELNAALVRAQEHLDVLRAEAEIERRLRRARLGRTPRVRAVVARWLIGLGERLQPAPTVPHRPRR
ncbi:MAG: hypothetical protein ACRDUY_10255 [Nitriliruptorales bacterium]